MAIDLSFGGTAFPRAFEVRKYLYDVAQCGLSDRFDVLDRYDAHYKCAEYDHQKQDWLGRDADSLETISPQAVLPFGFTQPAFEGSSLSIRQKRPTAPRRTSRMIVNRFTGLLFSETRIPDVRVAGDEDAEQFVRAVFKQARFWRTMYSARTFGGAMGSALVTVGLKDGRFRFRAISPKCVQDILWEDSDAKIPAGVLIQYVFERKVPNEKTGRLQSENYLYRRIIDIEADLIFKPEVLDPKRAPNMEIDEEASNRHGLGFCPAVWIQNTPCDEGLDGNADCEGAFQMMDDIDRKVSQEGFALDANMDPTLVLSRDPKIMAMGGGISKGSRNALDVGPGGSASYLEFGGGALNISQNYVSETRQRILDLCQAVAPDPEKISGSAQSAKAIEFVYAPMLEAAGVRREQYGEAIERIAMIVLDMARHALDPKNREDYTTVPRFDLPLRIIERDRDPLNPNAPVTRDYQAHAPGIGGVAEVSWGPYFSDTPQDVQFKISTLATAYSAGILDLSTVVREVAPLFDVEDSDQLLRNILEEQEARRKRELESFGGGFTQTQELPAITDSDLGIREDEGSSPRAAPEQLDSELIGMAGKVSDVALNGAQVTAAKQIVLDLSAGLISRESAKGMLVHFFSLSEESAEDILGPVSFHPETPSAPVSPSA